MAGQPGSTYRLQLHAGFNFTAAAEVAGYLAALGVTHVYTSPLLQAGPGSMHGYDVVDHSRASEELGGEQGRRQFADRLHAVGLGCVVDIVPNHMSVAVPQLNRWWWEVLAYGPAAEHATYFDIDWSRGRVLLPVLGDGPGALDQLRLLDGQLAYYQKRFPIADGTGEGSPQDVHERQHYELVSWRRADDELNYRRFFDVTELAGIRVEMDQVFADTHREVLRWVTAGDVDGLRIDHPDGLADPGQYLANLAAAAPACWVVVEKILEPGESLPEWRCAGTTGYDALREVGGVFVDPAGEEPLTQLYAELTGEPVDFAELAHDLKLRTATGNLGAETRRLAALLPGVPDVADAVAEVMASFGVYRSYLPESGAEHLSAAVAAATARRPDLVGAIAAVGAAGREDGTEFCTRLQQTTGMVMAKGVEDTAFYRDHRLVSLSEVGGNPTDFGVSPADFHTASGARQQHWPAAMTALSTHDTKRSEDVRARLAVLSELPDEWGAVVREWAARAPSPDRDIGYLAWQTLVGAWPLPHDRAWAYLKKAAREAKQHTSWTDVDKGYEDTLQAFVERVYADEDLLARIDAFAGRIAPYGWSNSLSQKLVQLTMPGVPDLYQGTELWDLALVDPDNRRPVDYALRRSLLARLDAGEPPARDDSGMAKLHVVSCALRLRRERPDVFRGSYCPITAAGQTADHALAFQRGGAVISVATRLPVGLQRAGGWQDTTLALPRGIWTDQLTGRAYGREVPLAALLDRLPVSVLAGETLAGIVAH